MKIILSENYIRLITASNIRGWWISPKNEKFEVGQSDFHAGVAQIIWTKEHGKRSKDIYGDMHELGWISLALYGHILNIGGNGAINKEQQKSIWSIIDKYKINHVSIRLGIANNNLDNTAKINMFLETIMNGQRVNIPKNIQTTINQNPQFFEPKANDISKVKIASRPFFLINRLV